MCFFLLLLFLFLSTTYFLWCFFFASTQQPTHSAHLHAHCARGSLITAWAASSPVLYLITRDEIHSDFIFNTWILIKLKVRRWPGEVAHGQVFVLCCEGEIDYPAVCPSVYLFVSLSVCLFIYRLSVCLSVYLFICVCLFVYLLTIYLSVDQFIYLSFFLSLCLSID